MKLEHYSDYTLEETDRAESALLTVWAILRDFREEIVLVGGLVPRYICRPVEGELTAVTMDVDLAVELGLSSGQYETTTNRLSHSGFVWEDTRFAKAVGSAKVFLDLLTDKSTPEDPDSVMVDDVPVGAVLGVERALKLFREVEISGRDLYGAEVTETVRVCEVGPFVCLKLLAYASRAKSKDVFDFVRCIRDYDSGPKEAVRRVHEEQSVNPAYEPALAVLRERFASAQGKGPVQYADFCVGGVPRDAEDAEFLRTTRINEALDVANLLLGS